VQRILSKGRWPLARHLLDAEFQTHRMQSHSEGVSWQAGAQPGAFLKNVSGAAFNPSVDLYTAILC
jgi:hypothetical protein